MEKVCECRIRQQGREKQVLGRGISSAGVGVGVSVGSIAAGGGGGNWRRARRDEGVVGTPGGEG